MKTPKLKLPKVFKKKWVAALRSGKYKQGQYRLHDTAEQGYCCLGVACRVAGVNSKLSTTYITPKLARYHSTIPKMLVGDPSSNPLVRKLAEYNDGNGPVYARSFKWIAAYIERYL